MTIQVGDIIMYTLAKTLGWWIVALKSSPNVVQFRSLSRRTAKDWLEANEPVGAK